MGIQGLCITKKCSTCLKEKDPDYFYNFKRSKDGKMGVCSDCRRKYRREEYQKNISRKRELGKINYHKHILRNKSYSLKARLGITLEDKEFILKKQNNRCLGCNKELNIDSAKVDHDHITKKIRGILCNSCNLVLGHSHDNITILENLINYLKRK